MKARVRRHRHAAVGGLPAWLCLAVCLAVGPGFGRSASAQQAPEATIEALHTGLYRVAVAQQDAGFAQRYRALAPLIAETHDLRYIAEFTIRRQWPALTPAEQQDFIAAFERLSIATYASRFAGIGENTLQIVGSGPAGGERVEVRARIARDSEADIPLDYVLHRRDGRWQIINIVADGVSDLALKRAEYQRVLTEGGFDALLTRLAQQAESLEAGASRRTSPQRTNR